VETTAVLATVAMKPMKAFAMWVSRLFSGMLMLPLIDPSFELILWTKLSC
jgi:hypothetical protein